MSNYVKQVGGSHYEKEFQHWDFVTYDNVPYLLAVATKYIDRWRKKNGLQDLEKSITYLEKADKMGVKPHIHTPSKFLEYTKGMNNEDFLIIKQILDVRSENQVSSIAMIEKLIEKYYSGEEASPSYVNQDR
ncbi:MAG: DUF3310 domain-containing protein [Actinomycetia bacterium]|nr:DUF3310 domain-containing protein [Actinomycetes bacterium]